MVGAIRTDARGEAGVERVEAVGRGARAEDEGDGEAGLEGEGVGVFDADGVEVVDVAQSGAPGFHGFVFLQIQEFAKGRITPEFVLVDDADLPQVGIALEEGAPVFEEAVTIRHLQSTTCPISPVNKKGRGPNGSSPGTAKRPSQTHAEPRRWGALLGPWLGSKLGGFGLPRPTQKLCY
jgi:hypothetical protein